MTLAPKSAPDFRRECALTHSIAFGKNAQPAPERCRSERVWDFPTSILQRKICICAHECTACHNNTTFQSVFNCFLFYRNFQKYQLSHIRGGKSHIQKSLAVWKPELERYTGLVQQIKEKSKERKTLVAEKKALPIYHVKRHKALAVRIAELTEDLEELRSEKALLFQKLEYAEDAGAEEFRKDIAIMEAGLKKLEAQEQKYSAELDKALDEYAEVKAQAADFDSVELYKARQAIRPVQEKAAEQELEDTLQKKPSFSLLLSAKQEVSRLLRDDADERQVRQVLIRRQRSDPQKPKHFQR